MPKPKNIKVYNGTDAKPIGYFSITGTPPNLVSFGTSIYELRPKHGPIQNDCYVLLGIAVRYNVFHNDVSKLK